MCDWRIRAVFVLLLFQLTEKCRAIESGDGDVSATSAFDNLLSAKGWIKSDSGEFVKIPEVGDVFEGDMIMSHSLRDAVLKRDKRTAMRDREYKWPDGVLPFTIAGGMPTNILDSIAQAIAHIHLETCIRLRPKNRGDEDYVRFDWRKDACSSAVGRQGGKQTINIGKNCILFGHVIHEIMHALGFIHEHSRPDRDQYIMIYYENIRPAQRSNFQKYSFADVDRLDMPYNFDSVMQYPNDAFTRNGKPTLISRRDPFRVFGQRTHFNQGDIKQINRLYTCNIKGRQHKSTKWWDFKLKAKNIPGRPARGQ